MKKIKPNLFSLLFFFLSTILTAQNIDTTSDQYLKIEKVFNEYKTLYEDRAFSDAITTANKALALYNSTYPNTSNILKIELLKYLSEHQDNLEDNIEMKLEVLAFYESKPEAYIFETAQTLFKIADTYLLGSNYLKSLKYSKRALNFFEQNNLGKDNINAVKGLLLNNYNALSIDASSNYDYKKASDYLDSLQNFVLELKGKVSYDYASLLQNRGLIHLSKGEESKAIPLLQESLALKTELAGEDNRGVIQEKSKLASIFESLGSTRKALKLYKEVYAKQIENYNEISIFPLITLNNIASIHNDLEEHDAAEDALKTAIQRGNEFIGPEHSVVVGLKISLANHFVAQNRTEEAKYILDELKTFIDDFYDDYKAEIISKMAFYPLATEQYQDALEMQKEALELLGYTENKVLNDKTLSILERIYGIHIAKKDFGEALKTEEEISKLIALNFGKESKTYLRRLRNRLFLNLKIENFEEAKNLLNTYNSYLLDHISSFFTVLNSNERENFINLVTNNDLKLLSIFNHVNTDTQLTDNSTALNNILIGKGLALKADLDIFARLRNLNDSTINKTIKSFKTLIQSIDKETQLPIEDRSLEYDNNKSLLDSLETKIVQFYRANYQDDLTIVKDWKNTSIESGELAIEFTSYNDLSKDENANFYAAYLYKKNWKEPKMVKLFKEKEIKQLLKNKTQPNTVYTTRGSKSRSTTVKQNVADSIYNLVWKPLEPFVNNSSKIYFSPDGILHKIAFAALPNNEGKLIGEVYNIQRVANTSSIHLKTKKPSLDDILLIGGVTYDYKTNTEETLENDTFSILESDLLLGNNKNRSIATSGFSYLKGTEKEIQNIKTLLPESTTLKGKNATETEFKHLSGRSPSIIHIATHGYFFPKLEKKDEEDSQTFQKARNPLLRSGLILANANYAWQNGNNPYEEDDGILTALEISNLDFSNTDIVVLSACETGLGDIDSSEGVYGLQRAFKMAGVKTIIMSLWEVPDAETAEFMISFYTLWKQFGDYKKAFKNTQLKMMQKYRDTPEKWAAFVLFE